jgi:hypothetical protein
VNAEVRVVALEVAGAEIRHAVPERQILGAGGRSNRVGLHETERVERVCQGRGWKKGSRDRVAPQIVDGQSPSIITFGGAWGVDRRPRLGLNMPPATSCFIVAWGLSCV